MEFDPATHPHRRTNPLTNETVLVSPHRAKRPWLGQLEPDGSVALPQYDSNCYLCPGNERVGGQENPPFTGTYTFENDFAAVLPAPCPPPPQSPHPLLSTEPIHGGCDVLVFHPRHDLTLARLSISEIEEIIVQWILIYHRRGAQPGIKYVQIFENKGSIMGCSNPHPHGQIWSMSAVPTLPAIELQSLKKYASVDAKSGDGPTGPQGHRCLLCDYATIELQFQDRVVVKNAHWVALVPWWAIWPFEVLVLPYQRHISSIATLTDEERYAFATILSNITTRYDNLFKCSFAYSMGIHQRPTPAVEGEPPNDQDFAHLHLHFDPPLLRNSQIRKFLVGFELMAEPQRDLTPEQAASRLRDCQEVHYMDIQQKAETPI